jgi:hypothetical protein
MMKAGAFALAFFMGFIRAGDLRNRWKNDAQPAKPFFKGLRVFS